MIEKRDCFSHTRWVHRLLLAMTGNKPECFAPLSVRGDPYLIEKRECGVRKPDCFAQNARNDRRLFCEAYGVRAAYAMITVEEMYADV